MENTFKYYSSGKFLLSGEYLVLDGAKSIGLPCNLGQTMELRTQAGSGQLIWESYTKDDKLWQACTLDVKDLQIVSFMDIAFAERLQQVIQACLDLGASPLDPAKDYLFKTQLEFDPAWGLGSSSTFIANISRHFKIDPYQLLAKTFGGSGYDIAAANANKAFYYQLEGGVPKTESIDFNPEFRSVLFFVYLNQKQNSRSGIKSYKSVTKNKDLYINKVSSISEAMASTDDLAQFSNLIEQHENLVSDLMGMPVVKDRLFQDFEGAVKSLGAWGGDFVLVCSSKGSEYINQYFEDKGYEVILPYDQIIKHQ